MAALLVSNLAIVAGNGCGALLLLRTRPGSPAACPGCAWTRL